MNWRKRIVWGLAALYVFMLGGAIASHLLWRSAPLRGEGSASFLFLAGVLILMTCHTSERWRLLLAGLIGFIAEVIGVQTGLLFGEYTYTNVLAPNLVGAPIAMICAWYLLIAYVRQMVSSFTTGGWLAVIVGSLWMTVIDLIIDPLAANPFHYWRWNETGAYYGIPFHNFVGWFGVSLLILTFDQIVFGRRVPKHTSAQWIGLSIIFLYAVCSLIYGFYLAACIGGLLCLIHLVLKARSWVWSVSDEAQPRKVYSVIQ